MTEREWRLRRRLDELTDERDEVRAEVERLRLRHRKAAGVRALRCVYCGAVTRCELRPAACAVHKPLLDVDPLYAEVA